MSKVIGNTNSNLINISDAIDLNSSSVLATSKAVATINNKLNKFTNGGQFVPDVSSTISNDLNNLTSNGSYFIYCTSGTTANAPVDLTGWFLIKNYVSPDGLIVQEAQLHSTTDGQPGYSLTRCRNTDGTWGTWNYSYAQFAG